jgi:hypothetical protein
MIPCLEFVRLVNLNFSVSAFLPALDVSSLSCVVVSVVWVHQACIIPFDGRTMAGLIMRLHRILLPRENIYDFFLANP